MRGLRTQESDSFELFFVEVQNAAKQTRHVFFLDFGECKDIPFGNLILDDLFGWLVPNDKSDEFVHGCVSSKWDDFALYAVPDTTHGRLNIEFKSFG